MKLTELMIVIEDLAINKDRIKTKTRTTLRDYSFVVINVDDYFYLAEVDLENNVISLERIKGMYSRLNSTNDKTERSK